MCVATPAFIISMRNNSVPIPHTQFINDFAWSQGSFLNYYYRVRFSRSIIHDEKLLLAYFCGKWDEKIFGRS